MRLLFLGFLFVLMLGCLAPQTAFTYEDISSPCSVVASGEVRALYGFRAIEETPVKEDDYTFCLFSGQTTRNESNIATRHYLTLMYVPYSQSNETIKENFWFENQTESAFILEKDLGMGDDSFLALHWNKDTKRIMHMSVVVLEENSAIIVTDAGYPMSGVDIKNKEKLKELARIALGRLT